MKARKKLGFFKKLLGLVLIVVIFTIIINRQVVFDLVLGMFYSPSTEMILIRENLGLTDRGTRIFNASRPELNNEESFNQNCSSYNEDEAILGCYTGRRIYVYEIREKELEGINELTVAHELLHAVYERMSVGERDVLKSSLEEVYAKNREVLGKEIDNYGSTEQLEEIYVRVGTEIKDLPEVLEKHYTEIFQNQDKIVSFYENYMEVFRGIESEFRALESEMKELNLRINANTAEYERKVSELNQEISQFNDCGNTRGCFRSEREFALRRNELVGRQNELRAFYDEISRLVEKYNANVARYNKNVIRHETLQNIINSHVRVEGL